MTQEKVARPWGSFETFVKNETVTVKILTVQPGEQLSVQYHHHRTEEWRIVAGAGEVLVGKEWRASKTGDQFFIEKEQQHSLRAGTEQLVVLEIARGEFDENDIVRVSDVYGRV
jgi:mannose-6-phosphate isomerase-like protein (cupin superfamily)